jgi:hypothetical protein
MKGLQFVSLLKHNGPAIKGGCVTWRSIRAGSWYFRQIIVPVQARYGACFCRHGTDFIALRRDRGTMFLSGRELLQVQKFDKWALAQYRGTMLSRRQKLVMVRDFNCVQMSVSGCNGHY